MGSEIFLSEISSQVKYNLKIKLYYVKIQRNIARATSNEIKIFKFQKNIFFKLITCLVHSYCPVIIITSHLLFLKVHFIVNPNAYLIGKFQPSGAENNKLTRILCTTVGPVALLMLKKAIFIHTFKKICIDKEHFLYTHLTIFKYMINTF